MRSIGTRSILLALAALVCGCAGSTRLLVQTPPPSGVPSSNPNAAQAIGFPLTATKNTTRVGGTDPTADAAGVALAVYPSAATGTHPEIVALAPTDNWQVALASAVFAAPPLKAAILLSGSSSPPPATSGALKTLAPTGSGPAGGAQAIRSATSLRRAACARPTSPDATPTRSRPP